MKTTKKITAAVAAIAVLMTLTACGSEPEPASTDSVETAVNMSDIESTSSATETASSIKTESSTQSATQSEAVTKDDPYAYLELINADYESCYDTMAHDACVVDGIAYFFAVAANPNDYGNLNDYKGYYSYNISTGETKCIVPYEKNFNHACYANGQIYAIVSNEVRCYDLDGNILKSYDFNYLNGITYAYDYKVEAVMPDGSCVIGDNIHGKGYHYLISSDFTSAKLICETKEGVHGTTEEIPYRHVIGGRGNILYAAEDGSNKVFYGIDVTTGEKTEYEVPDLGGLGVAADQVGLFGTEYFKCGTEIKKADTGETIATVGGSASNYYGGEYFYGFIVNKDMYALGIIKYPNNEGDAEKTVLFEYKSSDDVEFTFLNDEYYLVTDKYGTFLRNINSDEEKQIKFE